MDHHTEPSIIQPYFDNSQRAQDLVQDFFALYDEKINGMSEEAKQKIDSILAQQNIPTIDLIVNKMREHSPMSPNQNTFSKEVESRVRLTRGH